MDNLKSTYSRVLRYLSEHHLSQALAQLKAMALTAGAHWSVMRDIETLSESYGLLCRYALDGVNDPSRAELMEDIGNDIRRISVAILRQSDIAESPKQYFSVLRYEALQSDSSLCGLLNRYISGYAQYTRNSLIGKNADAASAVTRERELETLARRIFNVLWTTFPLTTEQCDNLSAMFVNPSVPDHFKELMVSAVTLGALEYYDESRMILLAKIYLDSSPRLEIKALCGLLINMWRHRLSLTGKHFHSVMDTVSERKQWASDLKMVFMELVRTKDTERISRTLNDDVLPKMIRMRPDIMKKIEQSGQSPEELLSLDENPEWAEMFEKSGLSDKLKELSDLQADGGDVMMSTFSHLKSFPFFNEVANWFLPFYPEHTAITEIMGGSGSDITELIGSTHMMCDSDKYSILLSLERIPAANRRMMLGQFKIQNVNLAEIRSSELNPELETRRNLCNKYVQDLYRFFNLYRRKSDFYNPFASPVNLASVKMLTRHIDDTDALTVVAEFYFKRGYYGEALELFRLIMDRSDLSPALLQKCGYSLQQTGRIEEAVEMYRRSELLRPDSIWTLRRLAQCYKMLGNTDMALEYYRRVGERKPDDLNVTLNIGHCCLEKGDYSEALKNYFKVEYLSPDQNKALRPIAWCTFLIGDYQRSADYYRRLLDADPTSSDYINMGHLQMALRNYREATDYYRKARQLLGGGNDAFFSKIDADRQYLSDAGVDPVMVDIVCDTVADS